MCLLCPLADNDGGHPPLRSNADHPGDEQWAGGGAGLLVGGAAEEARGLGDADAGTQRRRCIPSPANLTLLTRAFRVEVCEGGRHPLLDWTRDRRSGQKRRARRRARPLAPFTSLRGG